MIQTYDIVVPGRQEPSRSVLLELSGDIGAGRGQINLEPGLRWLRSDGTCLNNVQVADHRKASTDETALRNLLTLSLASPLPAQSITIARSGTQPSRPGPAANFTGSVRVDPLFEPAGTNRAAGSLVTFDAGAHSAWHTHPTGQVLIVTAGTGRVQQWGQPTDKIRVGDVVRIPPNTKHWHGAAPATSMAHISIVEQPATGSAVMWMEKVSPEQYNEPLRDTRPAATNEPTAAQRIMGDIAPALADLTDRVLFGEVWERPQLAPRDRSLVTVSALIAMNRPDQLRSHLARARENGVTQEELVEAITHLAFYSGWPNAVTAVGVAREVFNAEPQNR